ncbi:hypothetical protein DSM3645_27788 [Blastopirellula marina DSM 3645]|uniref:Uncharacterized protein n=1 Tax=Blastopirellula marina DSM 3645 TaxID=314230 RepID=A3ZX75_9BACT|nr:hypothetical protein DSM3645_27788 [Blastopirellula marina DSM 3645]
MAQSTSRQKCTKRTTKYAQEQRFHSNRLVNTGKANDNQFLEVSLDC